MRLRGRALGSILSHRRMPQLAIARPCERAGFGACINGVLDDVAHTGGAGDVSVAAEDDPFELGVCDVGIGVWESVVRVGWKI